MPRVKSIAYLLSLLLTVSFCKTIENISVEEDLTLKLRWSRAFPGHKQMDAEIGLLWALSYLGATLEPESAGNLLTWHNPKVVTLDLTQAGFTEHALQVWKTLLSEFRNSEEYQMIGSMDAGRFVLLTLNSTWHYYALTDIPPTFQEFVAGHEFTDSVLFEAGESSVAKGKRIVFRSAMSNDVHKMAFYAYEGIDSAGRFRIRDLEASFISHVDTAP